MTTQALLQQAKAACPQLAWLGSEEKNRAILQMQMSFSPQTRKICTRRRTSFQASCSTACA